MVSSSRSLPGLRVLAVAAVLFFAALPRPAAAQDYTDLWWAGPSQSGWGVNFIQADNFIFATFFIYGTANQPVWYTGQMTRDANGIWTGPLYVTAGTYFGAPWNPADNGISQVGTVTFTPISESNGTLTYNVGGVNVIKALERQTLQTIALGGSYLGGMAFEHVNCANPASNQTFSRYAELNVTQIVGGDVTLGFTIAGAQPLPCTFAGFATQAGQLYRLQQATYSCGLGSAIVYELKQTAQGIEGRWEAPIAGGCTEFGSFSAVLRLN